jgi:hypothetical protein
VSRLEDLVKELETLTPEELDSVAEMVERLKDTDGQRRFDLLERTAGALSSDEADELDAAVQECRRIGTSQQ